MSPSFLIYNLSKKIKIKKGNKNNRKEMNTVEYKEENQPWAARPSSGCELSRHSAKTVWATESRGTVQCKMPSGNVVEIRAAGHGCAAPKGTWREIEARLDPEWRGSEASFSALGQISALWTAGISAREEAQPSRFSSELPGACVSACCRTRNKSRS